MRYTVVWKPDAEAELAQLWLEAENKDQLAAASDELERLLRDHDAARNAIGVGNWRVLAVSPLGVEFLVNDADCKVTVITVWRIHE